MQNLIFSFLAALLAGLGLGSCEPQLPPCPDRSGGAFVTLQVLDDQVTFWITNPAFIAEAQRLLDAGEMRVPNFHQVIPGADCDSQWSWHVDPQQVEWADFTIELCDGTPSYIEEHLESWVEEVGGWCPWSAQVIQVEDRR